MRMKIAVAVAALSSAISSADPLPPDATYRPLPTVPPEVVRRNDEAAKPAVLRRQRDLLTARYDLADKPMAGAMMSGGRKAVQDGVRVKLRSGTTWDQLAQMSPADIKSKELLPAGFMPLPHVKQATGGQVFPREQIDTIAREESRDLNRFDVDFGRIRRLDLVQRAALHEQALDRVKRSELVMARGERLHLGFDAEQASDKIIEMRRDRDQQIRLGLRRQRGRVGTTREQPVAQCGVGFAEEREECGVEPSQSVSRVEIFERKMEVEPQHRKGVNYNRRTRSSPFFPLAMEHPCRSRTAFSS